MRDLLAYKGRTGTRLAGFSLLELLIVACVVAIMATVLLNRVLTYQKMAEKSAMEQTVGIMRSALNLQFASLAANNKMDQVPKLLEQNPMKWLAQKPGNYAGESFGSAPENIVAGQWYFDLKDRNLVYLVNNHGDVKPRTASPVQLRFKTNLVLGDGDFPGTGGQIAGKTIEGVVLQQIVPYGWD